MALHCRIEAAEATQMPWDDPGQKGGRVSSVEDSNDISVAEVEANKSELSLRDESDD